MNYSVATTAELTAALNAAKAGDDISLAAGNYKDFRYVGTDKDWSTAPVTIHSADPNQQAVFEGTFRMSEVTGVTFEDLEFDAGRLAPSSYFSWVWVYDASDITFDGVSMAGHLATAAEGKNPYSASTQWSDAITGFPRANGLQAKNVDGLVIKDSEFSDYLAGMYLKEVSDVEIDNVHIHDVRGGIHMLDVDDLSITNSLFEDLTPWLDISDPSYDKTEHDHPDMIQYWGVGSKTGVHDVTISDNVFSMPSGMSTQTIFGHMSGAPAGVTASNFTVTGNIILNGHPNAIYLGHVDGGLVAENVLLPNDASVAQGWTPRIVLPQSTNIDVTDNIAVDWYNADNLSLTPATLAARNVTVQNLQLLSLDPTASDYYGTMTPDEWLATLTGGTGTGTGSGAGSGTGTGTGTGGSTVPLTLNGTLQDDVFDGGEGDDSFLLRRGSDIATGNGGADSFVFDGRYQDDGAQHTVTDLNFAEDDKLWIRFFDTKNVILDSTADLDAFLARDDVSYVQDVDLTFSLVVAQTEISVTLIA